MDQQTLTAAGLPEAVVTELVKPEVMEKFTAFIESQKAPVVEKNKEIHSKLTDLNSFVTGLGGRDAIKALAEAASSKKEPAKDEGEASKLSQAQSIIDNLTKQVEDLKGSILQRDVSSALKQAIKDARGEPELLEPIVRQRIKTSVGEDGNAVIAVMNANGQPMLNSSGKDANLKDLMEELRSVPSYARAFDASKASGSGANAGSTLDVPGGVLNPWNPATFNLTKQMEMQKANPQQAQKLAALYGKTLNV